MEESVLVNYGTGSRLVTKVSEHYVRASVADLALACLVGVGDLYLAADDRHTYRALLSALVSVAGDKGRAFGDAVAVEDNYAYRLEEVYYSLVKCRAAADYHLKLAAEVRKHRLAEELASKVDSYLAKRIGYLDTLFKRSELTCLLSGRHDPLIEGLNEQRHKDKVRRLEELQLVENIAKSRGDVYLAALSKVTDEINGRAKGVVRRKREQSSLGNVEVIHSLLHIAADILQREHNSLALTRSSRCEHYRGKSFFVYLIVVPASVSRVVLFFTRGNERIKRGSTINSSSHRHERIKSGNACPHLRHLICNKIREECRLASRGIHNGHNIGYGKLLIDRHGYRTDRHQRGIREEPFNRCLT